VVRTERSACPPITRKAACCITRDPILDRVICVRAELPGAPSGLGRSAELVMVVHSVDVSVFHPGVRGGRGHQFASEGSPIVGTIARLVERRNN
jgi:hypothetical protein